MKRLTTIAVAVFTLGSPAWSQVAFDFTGDLAYAFPLESRFLAGGPGMTVGAEAIVDALPILRPRLEAGYGYAGLVDLSGEPVDDTSASLVLFGGGATARVATEGPLSAWGTVGGGYYLGLVAGEDDAGGNGYLGGSIGVGFGVGERTVVGLGAGYRALFGSSDGLLWSGMTAGLGVRYRWEPAAELDVESLEIEPLFPVLYKHYAQNPVGSITLENGTSYPATDLRVSVEVAGLMHNPTQVLTNATIEANSSREIPLVLVLNSDVMSLTEGDLVSARVDISYTVRGREYGDQVTTPVRFFDRNAITWDDDRKAAAYVTARDPRVQAIATAASRATSAVGVSGFDRNLTGALAAHATIRQYDLTYVVDPTSPYAELSRESQAIDYLKFPATTLGTRTGDCDDLSILYASVLESMGIETAFIPIPGHIVLAARLRMSEAEAVRTLHRPEDLIVVDDAVWLPIEATLPNASFLEAWDTGARQWREHAAAGDARLYPLHEAWGSYEPVAAFDTDTPVPVPDDRDIQSTVDTSWRRFVGREISTREGRLRERLQDSPRDFRTLNALGVLYARYGLLDQAEEQFLAASRVSVHAPTLVNLGSIAYLRGEPERALTYLERARAIDPDDPAVHIQLARVASELGRFDESRESFARASDIDAEFAARYSYLGAGAQARASASGEGVIPWVE